MKPPSDFGKCAQWVAYGTTESLLEGTAIPCVSPERQWDRWMHWELMHDISFTLPHLRYGVQEWVDVGASLRQTMGPPSLELLMTVLSMPSPRWETAQHLLTFGAPLGTDKHPWDALEVALNTIQWHYRHDSESFTSRSIDFVGHAIGFLSEEAANTPAPNQIRLFETLVDAPLAVLHHMRAAPLRWAEVDAATGQTLCEALTQRWNAGEGGSKKERAERVRWAHDMRIHERLQTAVMLASTDRARPRL